MICWIMLPQTSDDPSNDIIPATKNKHLAFQLLKSFKMFPSLEINETEEVGALSGIVFFVCCKHESKESTCQTL
jgi:hypothetical protein